MNEKIVDARLYQVVVNTEDGGALHIVNTYFMSENRRYIGAAYDRRFHSLPDESYVSDSPDTDFREQLRALDEANDAWEGDRESETERIKSKMKEAYRDTASVDIKRWI